MAAFSRINHLIMCKLRGEAFMITWLCLKTLRKTNDFPYVHVCKCVASTGEHFDRGVFGLKFTE